MARSLRKNRRQGVEGTSATSTLCLWQVLFVRLVIETAKYLELKEINRRGVDNDLDLRLHRGIIRGMALSHTKMFGNGYEPYWAEEVKSIEKAASRMAKEWISDGKPEDGDWWFARRRQLWRSEYDAAQV